MTLPASYPITLAQVCTEFSAPSNTPLGAFLRGGAYVPNIPANSGVPTAKPITLGNLLGATASVPYAATAAPTSSFNVRIGTGIVDSPTHTTTVTGSAGSLSYLWSKVSGGAITINNATSAATTFRANFLALSSRTAVFQCTVTDSVLGTTTTNTISVTLEAS